MPNALYSRFVRRCATQPFETAYSNAHDLGCTQDGLPSEAYEHKSLSNTRTVLVAPPWKTLTGHSRAPCYPNGMLSECCVAGVGLYVESVWMMADGWWHWR